MADQGNTVQPWIEYEAPAYDAAWEWKKAMEKYSAPPATERLEKRKSDFCKFMNSFFHRYKDKSVRKVCFEGRLATWDEAKDEAMGAFDEYTRQGRSWRHPFRTSGRLFGRVACRIEFLIELIPKGDYLGVLCGGLTLVYNAARRKRDIRELIIRTLDSLSEHVEGSKAYIRMYAWDSDLRQRTEDLYIAVLEAIEAMTEWMSHSFAESAKAFFQQSDYGRELEQKLSINLQDKALAFGNCVTLCLHKMVQTVHQNVLTAGQKVEQAEQNLAGGIGTLGNQIEQLGDATTRGLSAVQQTGKRQLDAMGSLEEQLEGIVKDVNWRFDQLENNQRNWLMQAMHNQTPNLNYLNITTVFMPQAMAPVIDVTQLLVLLNPELANAINPVEGALDRIRAERDFVFFHGRALGPNVQGSISFVIQNPQFQEWFKSMGSQIIVVQGTDIDVDLSSIVGPLGYMCVMLSQSVSRLSHAYPLAFFCRLHVNEEDKNRNARGLIKALVTQLLCVLANSQQPVDLSFLTNQALQSVHVGDISALCQLFDELLKCVSIGFIFCLIDGVFWFENESHAEELHMAMRFLNSLVMNVAASNTGVVFKLLVTSPMPSQYCRDWFPDRVELYLPGKALMPAQYDCLDWNIFGGTPENQTMDFAAFR